MNLWTIYQGDALETLKGMPDASFDAVLCDPPYGLKFMGKDWDHGVPSREVWAEVLRVLKPGTFLLAFGGTRTFHRLTCAIEDAGFEVRDMLCWLYGSGFPKSNNFGKKVDGFDGYGSALKPAWEPCIVAMKPLDGTFAENALKHGVAGINVEAGRIEGEGAEAGRTRHGGGVPGNGSSYELPDSRGPMPAGRWPANLILDESFDQEWSRFFYCAKASRRERDAGLDGFDKRVASVDNMDAAGRDPMNPRNYPKGSRRDRVEAGLPPTCPRANHHPCLKPLDLCRYLASLILPPQRDTPRRILVPFSGSGSEMIGALLAGWDEAVGIEREAEYCAIAEARLTHHIYADIFS